MDDEPEIGNQSPAALATSLNQTVAADHYAAAELGG
jgi:hypothetical protein